MEVDPDPPLQVSRHYIHDTQGEGEGSRLDRCLTLQELAFVHFDGVYLSRLWVLW